MKLICVKKIISVVVFAGNFNAGTGVQHDHFINYDNCNLAHGGISPPPIIIAPRRSFDSHVNDQGKQLLGMLKSLEIYES